MFYCLLCTIDWNESTILNTMLLLAGLRCRDVVEVRMDVGGIPCVLSDTAGLRMDSADPIELEGMRRAR